MALPLTIIILTYNEELNLPYALKSIDGLAQRVIVFDSFSTDQTTAIAKTYGCEVLEHKFVNMSAQRSAALLYCGIRTDWVLFLDADEWIPDQLRSEIERTILSNPQENGFYLKNRFYWMGKWIRRGYYPSPMLRLFRYGRAEVEARCENPEMIVEGQVGILQADYMHEDRKGVSEWIAKHNRYAYWEAREFLKPEPVLPKLSISNIRLQPVRRRWIRHRVWNHLPPLIRPFLYFGYRYVLKGGFLDGKVGFLYHFMHALWYRMLIDLVYTELRSRHVEDSARSARASG